MAENQGGRMDKVVMKGYFLTYHNKNTGKLLACMTPKGLGDARQKMKRFLRPSIIILWYNGEPLEAKYIDDVSNSILP